LRRSVCLDTRLRETLCLQIRQYSVEPLPHLSVTDLQAAFTGRWIDGDFLNDSGLTLSYDLSIDANWDGWGIQPPVDYPRIGPASQQLDERTFRLPHFQRH
jgi:hypothetical protein